MVVFNITFLFLLSHFTAGSLGEDTSTVEAWCHDPPGDDCRWYRECLAARYPCEQLNDSYALGFGERICQDFTYWRSDFTELGQQWIDSTRACLQKKLAPVLSIDKPMDCPDIQHYAFQTHVGCYIDPPQGAPNFCQLPFSDWLRIVWTIKYTFVRETFEAAKQGIQILGTCLSHHIEL